jgi:hypothetical protein
VTLISTRRDKKGPPKKGIPRNGAACSTAVGGLYWIGAIRTAFARPKGSSVIWRGSFSCSQRSDVCLRTGRNKPGAGAVRVQLYSWRTR